MVLLFSKAGLVTFSGFTFPNSWLDPMEAVKIIEKKTIPRTLKKRLIPPPPVQFFSL
jgi:hypothetical protein